MKDTLLQRWGISFVTIENEWTMSEYVCMVGAVIVSSQQGNRKGRSTNAKEFTDRQVAMHNGN